MIVLENLRPTPLDLRSGCHHHLAPLITTEDLYPDDELNHISLNLYSSENLSELYSEESSDAYSSDPYSIVVRPIDAYSVVSLIAIVERGQGPLYSIESQ